MEICCAVPEEGLNFNMNWEESIFPSIGDVLYLTQFLYREDCETLRNRERDGYNLFEILDDELLHVKDRSWLRNRDGKTYCLLILGY